VSSAGILAGLWPALRRILIGIGRWILDVILNEGRSGLAVYMRQRIGVFTRRLKRARKGSPRSRWLTGRIRRWTQGATWLEGAAAKALSKKIAQEAQRRAEDELQAGEPVFENFAAWSKAEKRRAARRARRAVTRPPRP
jgi:hypothetical protein